jgi:hypothetical protein
MSWIGSRQHVSEVRSFLGLVGYYRRFITNFSKFAKLITELRKKGNKYNWNDSCDEAFKVLKKLLSTSLVLTPPDIIKLVNVVGAHKMLISCTNISSKCMK